MNDAEITLLLTITMKKHLLLTFLISILLSCAQQDKLPKPDLVIYSAWDPSVLNPLVALYEKKTGKQLQVINGTAGILLVKLRAESAATLADVFLSNDAGFLWEAWLMELLKPLQSQILSRNVPAHLRSSDNAWFGLSQRATLVVFNKGVDAKSVVTYERLSGSQFQGKLCLISSENGDSQALVAGQLFHQGKKESLQIVKGWINNLTMPPFAQPEKLVDALKQGNCSVALLDSSVVVTQHRAGVILPFVWPNQESSGAHVNISGAAVLKNANYPTQAQAFVEWLTTLEAQTMLTHRNGELPILSTSRVKEVNWPHYQVDQTQLQRIIEKQPSAMKVIRKAGYQ